MSEEISALIDDEIDLQQHAELVDQLCMNSDLQDRWRRYQVIRSAIRGECVHSYFSSVYIHGHETPEFIEPTAELQPKPVEGLISQWLRTRWSNWFGGFGLAAGLTAAAAVGFISNSLLDVQLNQPNTDYVESAVIETSTTQWITLANRNSDVEPSIQFLNQTLIAHGESTSYPLINGLSNNARLDSY